MRNWLAWSIALAALVFLYLIRGILAPFVIAAILAYMLVPGIEALAARLRVRRFVIVASLYILFIGIVGLVIWFLRPALMTETRNLRSDAVAVVQGALVQLIGTGQIDVFGFIFDSQTLARALVDNAREVFASPRTAFQFAQTFFAVGAQILLTFVVLFYLLLDWEGLVGFAFRFVPAGQRERTRDLTRKIHEILGAYLRGQGVLVVFVAVLTWIALRFVFHVPFALPIAIATGFLEIIPLVGPVLAAGIAALSALSNGGVGSAVAVIVFYTVLRQVEDQLIAPNILGRAVDLHPLAAIFAVLAGGTLAGALGLILAIPVAAAVKVVLDAIQTPVRPEDLPLGDGAAESQERVGESAPRAEEKSAG